MVKKDPAKEGAKTDDDEPKESITLEKVWIANLELKEEMVLMKSSVEDVKEVCSKLLELTFTNKGKEEDAQKREQEYIERMRDEKIRKEQEFEEKFKEESKRKEYEYAEKLKRMSFAERERFLAKEKENELLIKIKEKGIEEQKRKEKYKEALRKIKEKEISKELPIVVTSESDSSDDELELNSDGKFPDFSGMSKNDIETYAYRMAAKRAYKSKKVVLKKNKRSVKDPHMNENLKGIMKNRLIEMKVSTAMIVPLITNGGNYGVIIEGLLPKWKNFLNLWIQDKEISRKEKLQFREQLQTAIAAYSGIKIMGEKAASIAKAALTDVKDGELRTSAHSILKSVEDDYGSYNKREFGSNYNNNYKGKGYANNNKENDGEVPPSGGYQGRKQYNNNNYNNNTEER
eukprot:GHVR01010543.1.p1 GENE.GHVR01010543.1~~GHVR01010543.1.p1  ORF type:complete len:403 (-),score=57.49 GHVR01010543.1:118-1326(-)